ncbi:MarR family winged helix-turn-helix transcriptional regulator [Streptacidiphilus sp. P02-A3a]|uniref:MarR family winged helix-turn-helix transcriptional regulator n=1 Tax=Streptacidiphilus sp. P02-A3a TaxID=2704468 RepID=UPI0015FE5428|nr:MarR family transcriptional regulator [Streptacidiphilus sp. P02-A3a]QMU70860.1 MarR family transcriptional regulator [Streptacidiphilus sp. P02-A3a]
MTITADPDDLLKLEHQVCFALHSASRTFGGVYREALRDLDLTYPQYLAMLTLWEHGELPVKRIGELLRLDSGTLSPLLKRLEAAGLVQRARSTEDERSVIVRPTATGTALRGRAGEVPRRIAAATGLDPAELRVLHGMLLRLTERLDAAGDVRGECGGTEQQ